MFADTKGVIRSRKSKKNRQYNGQTKNRQTTIYKTLHRKLKTEQHQPHLNEYEKKRKQMDRFCIL